MGIDYESAFLDLQEIVKLWYIKSRNDISDDCFKCTLQKMDELASKHTKE